MKILIIGGTRFQGKLLSRKLIELGHELTVFHRGINPIEKDLELDEVLGDRNKKEDLSRLVKNNYDWLIDTCCYTPRQSEAVVQVLGDSIAKTCFLSTAYVYKNSFPRIDENSPTVNETELQDSVHLNVNYSLNKSKCESIYRSFFDKQLLILRPCILIGPYDHTLRLKFWSDLISNLARPIVFSDDKKRQIQLLDVRDLVDFAVKSIILNRNGIYNVSADPIGFNQFLLLLAEFHGVKSEKQISLQWNIARDSGLDRSEVPYSLPESGDEYQSDRARQHGLVFRSKRISIYESLDNLSQREFDSEMRRSLDRLHLLGVSLRS